MTLDGLVAPLDRVNVDTDAILPKQFLKSITRTGFGDNLFDEWRYLDHGEPGQDCRHRPLNPDFSLNQARYRNANILLARANFGCGSSREHAVWALDEYGFRALIAPSFADIFYRNALKNGILPVVLGASIVADLFQLVSRTPGFHLRIDLEAQTVVTTEGRSISFDFDSTQKSSLLRGEDDIERTLTYAAEIRSYEARRRLEDPWIFE